MGHTVSYPCAEASILLTGFLRNTNPTLIIPLSIVQQCITFCSTKYLCFLMLCTGSKDYHFPQFNGIKLLNLHNKQTYYLKVTDLDLPETPTINHTVSFDGGMFTKCNYVLNVPLPSFIKNKISEFSNTHSIQYDCIFRFTGSQKTHFDLITFPSKYSYESDIINAYKISLPSLSEESAQPSIIYNEYNHKLYALAHEQYMNMDTKISFLYSLNFHDSESNRHDIEWNKLLKSPQDSRSLCIIPNDCGSQLLMLGSADVSNKAFLYDFNENKCNELSNMSLHRQEPGIHYDWFNQKIFVGESNVVEIYDTNKNKWNIFKRKTQKSYYHTPAIWTHPLHSNVIFIAGQKKYIDKERMYLEDLGVCEWNDLRSPTKWNILHNTDLLTLFKVDDLPLGRNIFVRSLAPIMKW
eukprot:44587_1